MLGEQFIPHTCKRNLQMSALVSEVAAEIFLIFYLLFACSPTSVVCEKQFLATMQA
jgi:hypothetical protein